MRGRPDNAKGEAPIADDYTALVRTAEQPVKQPHFVSPLAEDDDSSLNRLG